MKRRNRYQIYLDVIDACFWALSAWMVYWATGKLGWHSLYIPDALYPLVWLAARGTVFVLLFLLLIPGLRDEFSELAWKRAAVNFAYFMLIAPWIIWIGAGFLESRIIAEARLHEHLVSPMIYDQHRSTGIVHDHNVGGIAFNEFVGGLSLISTMGKLMPFIFTALFKWHRWRDGG